jgi:hypothetical protein
LIIEAVSENLSLKQEIFQEIDRLAPPEVILTSNTSGLRITDIAKHVKYPGRTVTTHFWFPAHLVPLVEVVLGEKSDETVAVQLHQLLLSWNKAPVIVRKICRDNWPAASAKRLSAGYRHCSNRYSYARMLTLPLRWEWVYAFCLGALEHIDAVAQSALSVQRDVLMASM